MRYLIAWYPREVRIVFELWNYLHDLHRIPTAHHSPLFDPSDGKCMFFVFLSVCNAVDLEKKYQQKQRESVFIDSIPKIIR